MERVFFVYFTPNSRQKIGLLVTQSNFALIRQTFGPTPLEWSLTIAEKLHEVNEALLSAFTLLYDYNFFRNSKIVY